MLQAAEGVENKGHEATIALRRPSVVLAGFVIGTIVEGGVGVGQCAVKVGIERVRPGDVFFYILFYFLLFFYYYYYFFFKG